MTGRNHHSAGMGSVAEVATGAPGNDSVRPNSVATIAEMLKLNGYNTGCVGKMHQTPVWEVSMSGPFDRWPTGDGFEKFYGFIGGETNQWAPTVVNGTAPVEPWGDGRGRLPLLGGHHRQGHRLGARPAGDDAGQALLPVRVVRRHPRAASRRAGVDRQVQGQVRQGLGRGPCGDPGQYEGQGPGAARHRADRPPRWRGRLGRVERHREERSTPA